MFSLSHYWPVKNPQEIRLNFLYAISIHLHCQSFHLDPYHADDWWWISGESAIGLARQLVVWHWVNELTFLRLNCVFKNLLNERICGLIIFCNQSPPLIVKILYTWEQVFIKALVLPNYTPVFLILHHHRFRSWELGTLLEQSNHIIISSDLIS